MTILAVVISLYPVAFAFVPGADGLFNSKDEVLLASTIYKPLFYTHTSFGGIALLFGSFQFFPKWRAKRLDLHRTFGKIYVVCVLLSGLAGIYVSLYATGGMVSILGFLGLAISWLLTTIMAYTSIRKGNVTAHQKWMLRSYALCFAAVTLRIYLGISAAFGIAFMTIYPMLAWLSWVPNLMYVELRIAKLK